MLLLFNFIIEKAQYKIGQLNKRLISKRGHLSTKNEMYLFSQYSSTQGFSE